MPPESRHEEPDPSILWRWVAKATQPIVGWVLVAIGVAAMTIGWIGISREVYPARQIPYLVSGGIFGLAMVFIGGVLIGLQDMRRHIGRISRLERLVEDLHGVLLSRPDVPDAGTTSPTNGSPDTVAVLPTGTSYHRPDCALVTGKDEVRRVPAEAAERDGLAPCGLCEPAGTSTTTAATAATTAR